MNTGTENNNELGISLLLVGVRGCLYIYRGREALLAALRPVGLCLCGCVYLSGKCVLAFYITRAYLYKGGFIGERRQSGLYKRGWDDVFSVLMDADLET